MKVISKDALMFGRQIRSLKKVQNICLCGLFIAAYVVLSFFSIKMTQYLEFRFAYLALIAAAAYGGPVMGLIAGAAGDVVSCFVAPQSGAFFPGFTLSYSLLGFLFGLILYHQKATLPRSFAASFAEFTVASTLNTLWLHFMYGMEWKYLFTIRLAKNAISLGIDFVMIFVFMKAFSRILSSVRFTPHAAAR